jgi:hypothetical protein
VRWVRIHWFGFVFWCAKVEQADAVEPAAAAAARRDVGPDTVASIILGGGAGTRLFPLTRTRAKPAVIKSHYPFFTVFTRTFRHAFDKHFIGCVQ